MSQAEPKEPREAIPAGWTQVGESRKGYPIITDGKARKTLVNGGMLDAEGNKGNSGGSGRPAERIRLKATESLDSQIEPIGKLLESVVNRAGAYFEADKNDQGLACLREIARLANTLTSIGPGTKVTNVVERDGYHDAAARAYDAHDGTKLDYLTKLKAELDAIP